MSVRIVGVGLSYIANAYLSRLLGIRAYGEYVIALSWSLVLMLPAKAGFDNSALRYASIYYECGQAGKLRGFIRFAAATVTSVWALMAIVILTAGGWFIPVQYASRVWIAALVLLLALVALLSVVLRTTRRIVAAQSYEQVLRPALLASAAAAVTFAGIRLTASSALALTTIAAAVALVGLALQLRRVLRAGDPQPAQFDQWREWLRVSIPLLMMGVVQEIMNQVDIILLGQLADERQAALFAAAWRLASLVPFALIALATMAGPLIASAYQRQALEEMRRVARLVARVGFGFACVTSIGLLVLGPTLLRLYGAEFVAAHPVLRILMLGGLVNAFTGVVGYFLTMTGHERRALAIFLCALVVSVGLNLLLIPRWGAVGSAFASSSALAFWNCAMLYDVRRTTGIDASVVAWSVR